MTPEALLMLVATALALIFEYAPKLHDTYNALLDNQQRLVMLVLIFAAAASLLGVKCVLDTACYALNWQQALMTFLAAIAINQGVHRVLPKSPKS